VRVLPVGGREEDFSLVADSGQKPGRVWGGTGPCQLAAKPKDALGRSEYDLVLFEDETEARPILVRLLQQAELP